MGKNDEPVVISDSPQGNDFIHFDTSIPHLGVPKVDSPIRSIPLFTRNGELVEKSFV